MSLKNYLHNFREIIRPTVELGGATVGIGLFLYGLTTPIQLGIESITRALGARDIVQRGMFLDNKIITTHHGRELIRSEFLTPEGERFYTADTLQISAGKYADNKVARNLKRKQWYDLQLVAFPELKKFNVLVQADKAQQAGN